MKNKSLENLINENVAYAKILDRLGLNISQDADKTLIEVCKEHGLNVERLVAILEKSSSRRAPEYLELRNYPVRLIVEYLKHAHQGFIKDTLPYIQKKSDELSESLHPMVGELKEVLPLFIEDFIHHIYEEEDRLFTYVCELEMLLARKSSSNLIKTKFNQFSIQEFALHHNDSDHEMRGIRGITNNYSLEAINDAKLRVLLKSLEQFDQELTIHANIENDILFPRALMLEKKLSLQLQQNVALN